jgi:PEP-CTERM motif
MERKGIIGKSFQVGRVFILCLLLLGLTQTKAFADSWGGGFGVFNWNTTNVSLSSFGVASFSDLGFFSLIDCTVSSACDGYSDGINFEMTAGSGLSFQTGQQMGVGATDGTAIVTTYGDLDSPCDSGNTPFGHFDILCNGAVQPQPSLTIHLAGLDASTDFLSNNKDFFFEAHLINYNQSGCSAMVAFGTGERTGEGSDDCTTSVPEPSSLLLLGSGMMGLGLWGRKRFRNTKD